MFFYLIWSGFAHISNLGTLHGSNRELDTENMGFLKVPVSL